jgi:hypothetical protein
MVAIRLKHPENHYRLLYMVHGTQKLFGFPAPFPVPHLPLLFLAGGMIETIGACFY